MSDVTIFAIGTVIFAVTIYGALGSLLMLGLTRLEKQDDAQTAGRRDAEVNQSDERAEPSPPSDVDS